MHMISDQGWFFLSAKDMLITGNIPLVGITSSHAWLHQGPLWTYILAVVISLGNFNPLAGGYLSTILDIVTIALIYKVSKELFSREVGLVAAVLYATSPLIIMFSRMPYHTSPIPLLATLFLLFLYRWIKGNVTYFPIIVFICALLYNFELATILFPIIVAIFLFYGLLKKKAWAKVFNYKIIFLSILSFLIPMLPILLYDFQNGFPQTVKFAGWIVFQVLGIFGVNITSQSPHESWVNFIFYFVDEYRRIVFSPSEIISSAVLLITVVLNLLFVYRLYKTKNFKKSYIVFYVCLLVLLLGFFSQRAKSGAYLTMLFPYLVLMIALVAGYLTKFNKAVYYLLVVFIFPIFNVFYILNQFHQSSGGGLKALISEAKFIVDDASGESFHLSKKNFQSNIDVNQYRYLVWWKGGKLKDNSPLEYGIYNASEGQPDKYIYKDDLIYITKTKKGQK